MTTLSRLTRNETEIAAGTNRAREKSLTTRRQSVAAFGRDLAFANEWFCPADAVAERLAKVLGESHGLTTAASLVRAFGHIVLAVIAQAEATQQRCRLRCHRSGSCDDRQTGIHGRRLP